MSRDDEHQLPGLPVAIPRPKTTPVIVADVVDDDTVDEHPDAPLDWRISGAVVGLLWAAFSSLMLSVAPPTPGTFGAWALATTIAAAVVGAQALAGASYARARALSPTTSAPRQALEQRATTGDVDRVEERLDEDPA